MNYPQYEIFYTIITFTYYNATKKTVLKHYRALLKPILFRGEDMVYSEYEKNEAHKILFTPKEKSYIIKIHTNRQYKMGKPVYNPLNQKTQINFIYHGSRNTKHLNSKNRVQM